MWTRSLRRCRRTVTVVASGLIQGREIWRRSAIRFDRGWRSDRGRGIEGRGRFARGHVAIGLRFIGLGFVGPEAGLGTTAEIFEERHD